MPLSLHAKQGPLSTTPSHCPHLLQINRPTASVRLTNTGHHTAMWRLTTGYALKRAATFTPEELGLPDWLDVFPSDGALEPQVRQPAGQLQSWPVKVSVYGLVTYIAGFCWQPSRICN